MAVEIKYEKVMVRGERKIKILRVSALKEMELPVQYTQDKRAFWMGQYSTKSLYFREGGYLEIGNVISKESFEVFVTRILTGGRLLKKINKKIAEIEEVWNGVKELKI